MRGGGDDDCRESGLYGSERYMYENNGVTDGEGTSKMAHAGCMRQPLKTG